MMSSFEATYCSCMSIFTEIKSVEDMKTFLAGDAAAVVGEWICTTKCEAYESVSQRARVQASEPR